MSVPESFGPYRVVRALARGGMAELYLAKKEGPGGFAKTVVVKRVLPQHASNLEFRQMFRDEARLASLLNHPNVVHISDFGEVDGSDFLAMEYLEGSDLGSVLARRIGARQGPLPAALVAQLAAQACAGLHHAHTAVGEGGQPLRLVHRDISPNNLFLTTAGVVKVLDFGIAKAEGKLAKTQAGMVKGKLLYMAPEQVRGRTVDARTDVWAMGLVLYELTTNVRPFFRGGEADERRLNELRTALAIEGETPPAPSTHGAGIPPEFDRIVLRCLEKSPEQRWPSAAALQEALEAFVTASGGVTSRTLTGLLEVGAEAAPQAGSAASGGDATELVAFPAAADPQAGVSTQLKPPPLEATGVLATSPQPGAAPSPADTVITVGVHEEVTRLKPSPASVTPSRAPSRAPLVAGVAVVALGLIGAAAWTRQAPAGAGEGRPDAPRPVVTRPAVPEPAPAAAVDAGAVGEPPVVATASPAEVPARAAEPAAVDAGVAAARPSAATAPVVASGDPQRAQTGRLELTCVPFGDVKVDGTSRGTASPKLSLELPAGPHRVTCIHPAFGEASARVSVKAGRAVERTLSY